jgi:predicted O-methyltransferase YrrM
MDVYLTNFHLNTFVNTEYDNYLDSAKQWYYKESGKEHYRLLSYLSTLYQNKTILDIGTYLGASAFALSFNKTNTIISLDISKKKKTLYNNQFPNIEFKIMNVLEHPKLIDASSLIFLDANHQGDFEKDIYNYLIDSKWNGVLIADDINLNKEMKLWWSSLDDSLKIDITKYGHWSGTGLVNFSKDNFYLV